MCRFRILFGLMIGEEFNGYYYTEPMTGNRRIWNEDYYNNANNGLLRSYAISECEELSNDEHLQG